ncbi:E3 ubiquitin-protein ligase CIP8-like [Humulus lupulus]|uniref:E3 ubiquitin-protein ligase CIP8-like n=1 Tax=Humulus lupulus TaxID=3486 RepID=UPI002B412366|nr:E3 ubiquitin-protein ligase CIP8-like [Humulus lupulus]
MEEEEEEEEDFGIFFNNNTEDSVTFTNTLMLSHDTYEALVKNDNADAKAVIDNLLASVNMPSSMYFLAKEIINYCRNNKDELLGVKVDVEIFVDELPLDEDDEDDGNELGIDDDIPINFAPASEKAIERLEKVLIKDEHASCSICVENVLVGSEATKLSCAHIYHEKCIVRWLQTSKFCPLCRFEIA